MNDVPGGPSFLDGPGHGSRALARGSAFGLAPNHIRMDHSPCVVV